MAFAFGPHFAQKFQRNGSEDPSFSMYVGLKVMLLGKPIRAVVRRCSHKGASRLERGLKEQVVELCYIPSLNFSWFFLSTIISVFGNFSSHVYPKFLSAYHTYLQGTSKTSGASTVEKAGDLGLNDAPLSPAKKTPRTTIKELIKGFWSDGWLFSYSPSSVFM